MENEAEPDVILAELGEGAYFGERALLKNDVRYAGIKANTKLKTLSISRGDFERVIGPLKDYIPDSH